MKLIVETYCLVFIRLENVQWHKICCTQNKTLETNVAIWDWRGEALTVDLIYQARN